MNVLVTGGAGFIGSHVAEALIIRGYTVTVVDNLSLGYKDWVPPEAVFINADITDLSAMRDVCKGQEGIFHLGAMSRVLPSLEGGPEACLFSADQNIRGTLNVLVAAAEAKVRKFVYSASSTYYGNHPPIHGEWLNPQCETPYAVSKYVGELYAHQFQRMYDLPVVCLRYFQVYGPRQPVKGTYAMVTGIFIDQWRKGQPLTIQGDGTQRRDFVHVHDVAKANVRAFERDVTGTINVGTGFSHSIQELADLISPDQVYVPARKHDMVETKADTRKCNMFLGWVPEIDFVKGTMALVKEAQ